MFTILALSNMNEIGFKDHRILRREKSNTLRAWLLNMPTQQQEANTRDEETNPGLKDWTSAKPKTGLSNFYILIQIISLPFFSCELRNKIISQDLWKAQDQLQCLV